MNDAKWMTQEEIDELVKTRELTGDAFIDAYQLGYDTARREYEMKVEAKEKERSDLYWKHFHAENECTKLKAENEKLAAKVSKLKRKLRKKGGAA